MPLALTPALSRREREREYEIQQTVKEVAQTRRLILEYPNAWHPLGPRLRRCHLKRFRYGLIYRIQGDVIEVVAVAHDRQKPEYWRDRVD
jgi:hypothetical protein